MIRACFKALLFLIRWALWLSWLGFLWSVRHILKALRGKPVTFGSARFAEHGELNRAGLCGSTGLIIGASGKGLSRKLIRLPGHENTILVAAPSGAGKGVGIVVPNLLAYPGSIIVTDPKGENYAITRRYRATRGKVWCLNLMNLDASCHFNPMEGFIRVGTAHMVDDCEALAELMLPRDRRADSHWHLKSKAYLAGLILFVVLSYPSGRRNLGEVHRIACAAGDRLAGYLELMKDCRHPRVAEVAEQIERGLASEETLNILSNLTKGTESWSEGRPMGQLCDRNDLDFSTFQHSVQSLYLVVPPEKLAIYAGVLRVVAGVAMHSFMRAGGEAHVKPLFVLDEMAALGYIEPLETGIAYSRAYWQNILVFQDLDQLDKIYEKSKSMVANTTALVAFGINDVDTARQISERIGRTTVATQNHGFSQASDAVLRHQASGGSGEAGRPLLDTSEILRLGTTEMLVFLNRLLRKPIRAERISYFREPMFKGLFDAWRTPSAVPIPWSPPLVGYTARSSSANIC